MVDNHNSESYLFALSFMFKSLTGLAIVIAHDEREAFGILKRQGANNWYPEGYVLIRSIQLGLYTKNLTAPTIYTQDDNIVVFESYTDALVAFQELERAIRGLSPVVPTVGTDLFWYVNGVIVTDPNGHYVSAEHTLVYDEETKCLIIDKDRYDSDGTPLQQVIDSISVALADWEYRYQVAEGTITSIAGDGSRWGSYKSAEASRDASYQVSEGTPTSTTDDGSRWGSYKAAEESREESYGTEEGSVSSTAGDGSRWGSYKSAEANRNAESALAEGTSGSVAGDGSRWGAYKYAETVRQSSYGDAETNRNSAYLTAEGNSTSVAGDGSRWGTYKTAEAARDAISSEDHTQAEADHTRAGEDHTQAVSDHATWADKADTDGYYERMGVGTAKNLEGVVSQSAEIIFRKTGGSASVDSGLATMSSIKGKTLVWNQLVSNCASANQVYGITRTRVNNYTVHYSGTSGQSTTFTGTTANISVIEGHKYYMAANNAPAGCRVRGGSGLLTSEYALSVIVTANTSSAISSVGLYIPYNTIIDNDVHFVLIDLTLMFGAGNEPTTVAEFEAMYPLPYYAYNSGQIVSNKATALETVGFNQWDEEWELGQYHPYTGETMSSSTNIRSKNYIPVLPGRAYYFKTPSQLRICQYDGSKNFISIIPGGATDRAVTLDGQAHFIMICTTNGATTTYNNNICINLSDAAKNGTYQPYEKHTLELNLPTLTGKLNGEGSSVVIAPEGLAGDGDWADLGIVEDGYLTKVIKKTPRVEVDLGDLSWVLQNDAGNNRFSTNSYDFAIPNATAANAVPNMVCGYCLPNSYNNIIGYTDQYGIGIFTTNGRTYIQVRDARLAGKTNDQAAEALSGVKLIYELATPETYVLDNPVYVGYLEDGGGTERRLPEDTASSVLAPLACDVTYPMDAVGAITTHTTQISSLSTAKADKDTNAVAGNLAKFDSSGNPVDSGVAYDDVLVDTDIVDNLTTEDATKVLSAKQGVVLEGEISQLGQELDEEIDGIPAVNISGTIPVVAGQVNQRTSGAKCVIDIPAGTYFFQMDSSFFNGLCRVYARINGSETHIGDLANINETSVTLPNDATEIYIYCTATVAVKTGDCSFSLSQDGVRGIRDDIADLEDKTEKIDGVSKDTSVSFTLTTTSQSAAGTKKDANIKKGKYWVDVSPMSLLTASNVYVYAYYASAPATSVLIGYIGTNMLNYWVLNGNTYLHEIQFNEDVVALSIYHANNATGAGNIALSFVDQEAVPSFDATIAQLKKKTSPVFSAFSDSGEIAVSGGVLALPKVHITKNSALSLEIDGTIEDVAFGIGYSATAGNKRGYTGYWCVLKPTTLEIYYSDNSTILINSITHGLTLDDKTKVSIRVMDNVGTRKIRITTKAGAVYENTANINFFGVGSPFVENNNASVQISAKISFLPCDLPKRVWVFGDSYCGVNNSARWMTQILNMGIGGFLLNAKGGEAAAEAVSDLDNLLSLGCLPTYILWCLGMNGTADGNETTVSDYQKLWLMRFLRRCKQNGITPVLCTIPTVPSLQHNAYNAYIKTLGYRFVDLADAVGAQADGTWYPGLISSDNVHPSEEGARVLAARVLLDFPEIQLL